MYNTNKFSFTLLLLFQTASIDFELFEVEMERLTGFELKKCSLQKQHGTLNGWRFLFT